jgi:hypothetical protein
MCQTGEAARRARPSRGSCRRRLFASELRLARGGARIDAVARLQTLPSLRDATHGQPRRFDQELNRRRLRALRTRPRRPLPRPQPTAAATPGPPLDHQATTSHRPRPSRHHYGERFQSEQAVHTESTQHEIARRGLARSPVSVSHPPPHASATRTGRARSSGSTDRPASHIRRSHICRTHAGYTDTSQQTRASTNAGPGAGTDADPARRHSAHLGARSRVRVDRRISQPEAPVLTNFARAASGCAATRRRRRRSRTCGEAATRPP